MATLDIVEKTCIVQKDGVIWLDIDGTLVAGQRILQLACSFKVYAHVVVNFGLLWEHMKSILVVVVSGLGLPLLFQNDAEIDPCFVVIRL